VSTAWYIPPRWLEPTDPEPTTILEAAHLAATVAERGSHTIPFSEIPLIVHQTWKDANVTTWANNLLDGAEQWLAYAKQGGGMAYFLWLDDGCEGLIAENEPQILEHYKVLPLPVERSDIFRIVVVNSLGGIVSHASPYSTTER
jgi:mannosyltransferase OCH1-like enzyme